jgi:hypothetical protein
MAQQKATIPTNPGHCRRWTLRQIDLRCTNVVLYFPTRPAAGCNFGRPFVCKSSNLASNRSWSDCKDSFCCCCCSLLVGGIVSSPIVARTRTIAGSRSPSWPKRARAGCFVGTARYPAGPARKRRPHWEERPHRYCDDCGEVSHAIGQAMNRHGDEPPMKHSG